MNQRLEFKRTIIRMIFYFVVINVLVAVGLFLTRGNLHSNTPWIMFLIINLSYLVTAISKPFRIIIDQDKLLLEIYYPLSLRKHRIIPLNEVVCSFEYEVRARGSKSKVLRIMRDTKTIVELLPDYNGWNEQSLIQICEKLNDLKKFN
jgi:hypothetical protein